MFRNRVTRLMFTVSVGLVAAGSVAWSLVFVVGTIVAEQPVWKVIIDTDAGIDDAVAMAFALSEKSVEVQAITCVKGNSDVDNVVVNVLKILKICNKTHIPVYSGNNHGLIVDIDATGYFGADGMGDINFPDPPTIQEKQKEHAAIQLVKMVTENPGEITLICLGPLTNLALAISINPSFLSLLKKVIILGGTLRGMGNQSPGVEFNFYCDPDAASLVLRRASLFSQTVTIVPLEPIDEAKFSWDWRWNEFANINSHVVTFLNQIEKANLKLHPNSNHYKPYDGCAVAVLLVPEFVTASEQVYVSIDPFGQTARGAVLIDHYNITKNKANVDMITELNAKAYQQKLIEVFEKSNLS